MDSSQGVLFPSLGLDPESRRPGVCKLLNLDGRLIADGDLFGPSARHAFSNLRSRWLLLGAHDAATGDLGYLGDVGTGFTEHALRELSRDDLRHVRWVEPEVVYRQFTRADRRLRHAAWRGLRPDRDPARIIAARTHPRPPHTNTGGVGAGVGGGAAAVAVHLDKQLPYRAAAPVTPRPGSPLSAYPAAAPSDDLPTLVWAANLAALELHVPQWTINRHGEPRPPNRLVFDPGPDTTIVGCCRVAERLAAETPGLVTKTTITPYSLRGRDHPTAATPAPGTRSEPAAPPNTSPSPPTTSATSTFRVALPTDLLDVALPLVISVSTLDAPDRPGLEWVFVARRP